MLVRSVVLVFEGVLDGAGPSFVIVADRLMLGLNTIIIEQGVGIGLFGLLFVA